MALELEQKIMQAIGLGMHFSWFNGSRSCGHIRRLAVDKLADAILASHKGGAGITAPDHDLCHIVAVVAQVETDMFGQPSEDELTKTWQAASEVIAAHIHMHGDPEHAKELKTRTLNYITATYLPVRNASQYFKDVQRAYNRRSYSLDTPYFEAWEAWLDPDDEE